MTGSLRRAIGALVLMAGVAAPAVRAGGDGAGPYRRFLAALRGEGLTDSFIYHLSWDDYRSFPDPFPRRTFAVREVRATIERYPDPRRKGRLFRWDIHGHLLLPTRETLPSTAMVMIHGGAANEYEFLFTPDGPEQFPDLTRLDPGHARVGVAQHVASLGIPVLAISLPGHYRARPWAPISVRRPEFVLGRVPDDEELAARLRVYTFRMCLEAIKTLIEEALPGRGLYVWGHSTGGEYFYLLEQYGLTNRLLGDLGFGTGMPASLRRRWDEAAGNLDKAEARPFTSLAVLSRRSPSGYEESGYTGPNQPWGSAAEWFRREEKRRAMFKPLLQDIEHEGLASLHEEVRRASGLPDEELFVTLRADLTRLRGKKVLHFVGELDRGHWVDGGEKGTRLRREVYALEEFARHSDLVRLVVIPRLTHYGHIESHNERLANLMVTALRDYFPPGRP